MNIFIKSLIICFIAVFLITSAGRIFLKPLTDPTYHREQSSTTGPVVASDANKNNTSSITSNSETNKSSLTPGQDAAAGAGYSTELAAPGAQTGAPVQNQ